MNISQICEKYHVYTAKDINIAWEKYVIGESDPETWEYNAAMLDSLQYYFSIRAKREAVLNNGEEAALKAIIDWINISMMHNSAALVVSATKKTQRKAAEAARGKLGWHLYRDIPTEIDIIKTENGRFECRIHGDILFSPKAGEKTMELLDKDRFTNDFMALSYAAKCRNIDACYRIGNNLAGADAQRTKTIISHVTSFDFPDIEITVKGAGRNGGSMTYTLTNRMPVYWYYLGAEGGGTNSAYEAALIFRRQNIHSLCVKYMYKLTQYDNNHQAEAERIVLEELATQNIPESIISKEQRNWLLNRLVGRFSKDSYSNLSKSALQLLAEQAFQQNKFDACVDYYQRAGIKTPKDTTDKTLISRMGNMLYDMGKREDALGWLQSAYAHNLFFPSVAANYSAKIGKIYLERWKRSKSADDAQRAASYLKLSTPEPKDMAELLRMHQDKVIDLDNSTLRKYARESADFLDAKTANSIGYQLWVANKTAEDELPAFLLRKAVALDGANGTYWINLGYILAYNTLYGAGFSYEKLEEAEQCLETARKLGRVWANVYLSDCYWHDNKAGFPQDFETAKELLQSIIKTDDKKLQYAIHIRLAKIGWLEKQPMGMVAEHYVKAHQANTKGNAAVGFQRLYGKWLSDYVELLYRDGSLQKEMEALFCGNADYIYAVAQQQEQAGYYRPAIMLYGCSAAMGNKKAIYSLYNISRHDTNYFTQKEATQ